MITNELLAEKVNKSLETILGNHKKITNINQNKLLRISKLKSIKNRIGFFRQRITLEDRRILCILGLETSQYFGDELLEYEEDDDGT